MNNYPSGMSRSDLIHVGEIDGYECDACECEEWDAPLYGRDNGAGEWVVCPDDPKVCTCPDYECEPCECECHWASEPSYD